MAHYIPKVGDVVINNGASIAANKGLVGTVLHVSTSAVVVRRADDLRVEWYIRSCDLTPSAVPPMPLGAMAKQPEYSGGSVSYYEVLVKNPTKGDRAPYTAECNDIIEALGMNYAEGNAFKALWRKAAAAKLGKHKQGNTPLYDAEKVEFFGKRLVAQEKAKIA